MTDNTATVLAELMLKQDLSQVELSRLTGVGQSTISRILNPYLAKGIKNPSDMQVRPLATYFRVSTDQLRGYEPLPGKGAPNRISSVQLPDDWDIWLQKLTQIQEPGTVRALRGIVALFADNQLSRDDARILEEISKRFSKRN